jgi:hypothetical protein
MVVLSATITSNNRQKIMFPDTLHKYKFHKFTVRQLKIKPDPPVQNSLIIQIDKLNTKKELTTGLDYSISAPIPTGATDYTYFNMYDRPDLLSNEAIHLDHIIMYLTDSGEEYIAGGTFKLFIEFEIM